MDEQIWTPGEVFVGRDMGGREVTLSPRLIERYAAGTGDNHPWYSAASPFDGPIAPALLLHSEVYRDLGWYLPDGVIGNLHAKQEWELFAPMPSGSAVRTRSTIVDRYRKRQRDYVVNEVLITDVDGRWLQRSRTHQSFPVERPLGLAVDKSREKQSDRRFEVGSGDGALLGALEKTVDHAMCVAFSGPAKNYHTDPEEARKLGFPDIVVQGMMSICFVSELMTREFGAAWLCGGRLSVNLVNVLWGGESLVVRAQVRDQAPEGERTRVHVDVWCEKPDATRTLVGTASALGVST